MNKFIIHYFFYEVLENEKKKKRTADKNRADLHITDKIIT